MRRGKKSVRASVRAYVRVSFSDFKASRSRRRSLLSHRLPRGDVAGELNTLDFIDARYEQTKELGVAGYKVARRDRAGQDLRDGQNERRAGVLGGPRGVFISCALPTPPFHRGARAGGDVCRTVPRRAVTLSAYVSSLICSTIQ